MPDDDFRMCSRVILSPLQDEVALELNKAVLYSYKKAGVSIVDHFTQVEI